MNTNGCGSDFPLIKIKDATETKVKKVGYFW